MISYLTKRLPRGNIILLAVAFCFLLLGAVPLERVFAEDIWVKESIEMDQDKSISIDSSNNPHISYYDSTNKSLNFKYKDNSGWHTETIDNGSEFVGITLIYSGKPHVCYYDKTNKVYKYAYKDASGWVIETLNEFISDIDPSENWKASFCLDNNGYPHLTYIDTSENKSKYAYKDSSGWHTETLTFPAGKLALDRNGNPHICYYDSTNKELKVAQKNASGWDTETVDTGYEFYDYDLVIDAAGNSHIAYFQFNQSDWEKARSVKYAYKDANGWHLENLRQSLALYNFSSLSLEVDSLNNPHICFYSCLYDNNAGTNYYHKENAVWQKESIETIPESHCAQNYISFVLDSFGCPHIIYDIPYHTNDGIVYRNYKYKLPPVVDNTPPVIESFSINDGAQYTGNTSVTLRLQVNDNETPQNRIKVSYSNDNQNWTDWASYSPVSKGWEIPGGAGNKNIYIRVKDLGEHIATSQASIRLFTMDLYLSQAIVDTGNNITLVATADGIDNPVYQFWAQSPLDGTWSLRSDYSENNSYTFTETVPGSYFIVAYVKPSGMPDSIAINKSNSVSFKKDKAVYHLNMDGPRPNQNINQSWPEGSSATFEASAANNGGAPMYQFWVHDQNGWRIAQAWSIINKFKIDNLPPGSYVIAANALDSTDIEAGNWGATYVKSAVINVGSTLTINAPANVAPGETVNITAQTQNITGQEYQFWYQSPDGSWHQSGDYTSSNTFSFVAETPGTYRVVVYAKDHYALSNGSSGVWDESILECR